MADPDPQTPKDPPEASEGTKLRTQLEATLTENKILRDTLLDQTFAQAGVDITKGRAKNARAHYEGEANLEAVKKYLVDEYEVELPTGTQTPAVATLGSAIGEVQDRIEQIGASGTSLTEAGIDQQIAEAQEAGDWARAIALKTSKLGLKT